MNFLLCLEPLPFWQHFFLPIGAKCKRRNPIPPWGNVLEVNGKLIPAIVMGEGPDIVLIHGSSGNLRDYTTSIASELANSYRVILFNCPGLGHLEKVTYLCDTPKDRARLLRDAVLMLGAKRRNFLGQSYGGSDALAWVLEAKDDIGALVNVSCVSHPWTTDLGTYYKVTSHPYFGRARALYISAFAPERLIKTSLKEAFAPQSPSQTHRQEFGVELVLRKKTILANARQRRILKQQIIAQAPRYSALTLPIEIIHGIEDTVVSPGVHAKALERGAQNAHLTFLEGIGHMPHHVA